MKHSFQSFSALRESLRKNSKVVLGCWFAAFLSLMFGANAAVDFSNHLISGEYTYPYGVGLGDLDGDGDLDIVSSDCTTIGSRLHNDIYWYENSGKGEFQRRYIAKDDWYGRYERFKIADMNRDARLDIVIVDNFFGHLLWFENSGRLRDGKLWKRHEITLGGLLGAYDVDVADFDGDGRPDVVASSWRMGNQFVWYQNPEPSLDGEWKAHVIDANQQETRMVAAADFNGDGRPDVLGGTTGAGIVLWYENPRDPKTQTWKRHVIDLRAFPMHGHPADMDNDGDIDVVVAYGGPYGGATLREQVMWYENEGRLGKGVRWVKHVIGDLNQAFEALPADLDGDGAPEVVVTAFGKSGQIGWFANTGNRESPWRFHSLFANWPDAVQAVVGDVDTDGRPDIVAVAERGSRELRWWRNEGRK